MTSPSATTYHWNLKPRFLLQFRTKPNQTSAQDIQQNQINQLFLKKWTKAFANSAGVGTCAYYTYGETAQNI